MNIERVFEYRPPLGFVPVLKILFFLLGSGHFWVIGIIVMVFMLVLWLQLPKCWDSEF